MKIYATSFYSSSLWNLCSTQCERIYTSWNIAIRMIFKVPNKTHRYLIESLSQTPHVKTMLSSRFMQFHDSLIENKKSCIRLLASLCTSDKKTSLGRNLSQIQRNLDCNREELSSGFIKEHMKYSSVPEEEQWRIPLLLNLLDVRNNTMELNNFLEDEVKYLIEDICVN